MKMPLSSRLILTLNGILLPVGAHIADFNETHIFNPHWPPHAKFHGAQTLMFSSLLCLCSVFFALRKTNERLTSVLAASFFGAIYWVAQAGAILYPGTAVFDPDTIKPMSMISGIPVQTWGEIFFLILIGLATWLALKPNANWTN
jgi:hypothetical protein